MIHIEDLKSEITVLKKRNSEIEKRMLQLEDKLENSNANQCDSSLTFNCKSCSYRCKTSHGLKVHTGKAHKHVIENELLRWEDQHKPYSVAPASEYPSSPHQSSSSLSIYVPMDATRARL